MRKTCLYFSAALLFLAGCQEASKTDGAAPDSALDGEIDSAGVNVEKTYPYEIQELDWEHNYWFISKTEHATMDPLDLERVYGNIFGTIFPYLMEQHVSPVKQPIAIGWEMPDNNTDSIPITGGALVADSVEAIEGWTVAPFFKGKVLRVAYYGPYMKMEKAYASAREFMADNDMVETGFGWEEYVSDAETVKEDSILTYIYRAIK